MRTYDPKDGPKIITAAWTTELPAHVVRVGISRGWPRSTSGYRRLPLLAPGRWWRDVNETEYVVRYEEQLSQLRPAHVYSRLVHLAHDAPTVALLCFERPATDDGWCHRALAAQWLSNGLGVPVPEYGFEHLPQDRHPLLPPSLLHVGPTAQDPIAPT